MNKKPIIIWDWDGTLIETIEFKYDGVWKKVFIDEPEKEKIVIDYLRTPAGKAVTRYGLISYVLSKTNRKEIAEMSDQEISSDSEVLLYVDRYMRATDEFVHEIGLTAAVKRMLQDMKEQGYRMYLISGGGTDEYLQGLVDDFGISQYFLGVFGFGSSGVVTKFGKKENFHRVETLENGVGGKQYLVIGDSFTDYEFSRDISADFIGVSTKTNGWSAQTVDFTIVNDVTQVQNLVGK